jgi:hypothetical protein
MLLTNLDPTTRGFMREEIERDNSSGSLYFSNRLSASGRRDYVALLLEAADHGDAESLAVELARPGRMEVTEIAVRKGKPYSKRVPVTAGETLAEGEFNRFYARGLCLRALDEGFENLRIYRAKAVMTPRSSSEEAIGSLVNAGALLEDLRISIGVEPALGLPPGPNSGLSVELPT